MASQETVKESHTAEFRFVYSNTVAFQFNGSELILKFGMMKDLGNPAAGNEFQVGVVMNAPNMKALAHGLTAAIAHHEKATGAPIPLNPQIQENIEKAIAAASGKKP